MGASVRLARLRVGPRGHGARRSALRRRRRRGLRPRGLPDHAARRLRRTHRDRLHFASPYGPNAGHAVDPTGVAVAFTASAIDAVDGDVPVACSPASGSVFPIGTTTVNCSATDAAGNSASASFVVHVKGATEQLADLEVAVAGIGAGTSLADKVANARAALAAGAIDEACEILAAFDHHVIAQSGKSISEAVAAELFSTAARIQAVLAC
jgi:hypothetical protein